MINITIIIALLILIFAVLIWVYFFKPIFKLINKLSAIIREEISQDIHTSHNSLTTLASAAIVLTFSVLEIFSISSIYEVSLIVATWIGFLICVLLGMGIGISSYVGRMVSKVLVNSFVAADKKKTAGENITEDDKEVLNYTLVKQMQLQRIRFWLLYGQSVAFATGTIFLTAFAIVNVMARI